MIDYPVKGGRSEQILSVAMVYARPKRIYIGACDVYEGLISGAG